MPSQDTPTLTEETTEIPYGFCKCGCGERTPLVKRTRKTMGYFKGEPLSFLNGHRGRLMIRPSRIRIDGDFAFVELNSEKYPELEAVLDVADIELVNQYRWHLRPDPYGKFYAATRVMGKRVYMHRIIAGAVKGQEVDHWNGNGLDNRGENIRKCSHQQNIANRFSGVRPASGFRGVLERTPGKGWSASIENHGQVTRLGTYQSAEDAARAYDAAARELFGEFGIYNFPEPGERSSITGKIAA